MASRLDKWRAEVDRKLALLLKRREHADYMERRRRAQQVGQLKDRIKQMKVEKIALLNYIRELEQLLRVESPMKLPNDKT